MCFQFFMYLTACIFRVFLIRFFHFHFVLLELFRCSFKHFVCGKWKAIHFNSTSSICKFFTFCRHLHSTKSLSVCTTWTENSHHQHHRPATQPSPLSVTLLKWFCRPIIIVVMVAALNGFALAVAAEAAINFSFLIFCPLYFCLKVVDEGKWMQTFCFSRICKEYNDETFKSHEKHWICFIPLL